MIGKATGESCDTLFLWRKRKEMSSVLRPFFVFGPPPIFGRELKSSGFRALTMISWRQYDLKDHRPNLSA